MMVRTHFEVGQSALSIVCDDSFLDAVKNAVFEARSIIEAKIAEDPFFGITYDPYPPSEGDHPLVIKMCQASVKANVGPMAGVAGAVAFHAVSAAVAEGCTHIIAENGGDISMRTDRTVHVGVFAGEKGFEDIALKIPPTDGISGICSSSGKIGPSVSFGSSGICTVFSGDTVLADCCATALGNMIVTGEKEELAHSCEAICSIDGVDGCICVCNGSMSVCGTVPELVRGRFDDTLFTRVNL